MCLLRRREEERLGSRSCSAVTKTVRLTAGGATVHQQHCSQSQPPGVRAVVMLRRGGDFMVGRDRSLTCHLRVVYRMRPSLAPSCVGFAGFQLYATVALRQRA